MVFTSCRFLDRGVSIYIRSEHIGVVGLDIHYLVGGKGYPLVLVHGGGAGARTWLKNLRLLCRRFTVYAPDLPGFGDSQPLNDHTELDKFVSFVEDFTQALGLKKYYLLGHSMGGGIALKYALEHPDKIERLVIADSMCLGKEIAPWVKFFSQPIFCETIGRGFVLLFHGIGLFIDRFFRSLEFINPLPQTKMELGNMITNLTGQNVVLLDRLSTLLMPTLVVWGARDGIVPVRHAYAAARVIPNCHVHIFKDCGHVVHHQRVDDFSNVITHFLNGSGSLKQPALTQ